MGFISLVALPSAPKGSAASYFKAAGLAMIDQPGPKRSRLLADMSLEMAQAAKYFSMGECKHGAGFLLVASGDARAIWQ